MHLLKLLHAIVKVVLGFNCTLPNKTKPKFDQYSIPWVRCAFGIVFYKAGHLTLNIVGSVVSAYLILRCTFSYYVDEAGGVGCTGADVCSEQVGASCLQMVVALDQAACKSNFFLLPPTCTHPCSHCPLCSVDSPSLAIRLVALKCH